MRRLIRASTSLCLAQTLKTEWNTVKLLDWYYPMSVNEKCITNVNVIWTITPFCSLSQIVGISHTQACPLSICPLSLFARVMLDLEMRTGYKLSLSLICAHTHTHTLNIWYILDLLQIIWISKPEGVKSSIIPTPLFFSLRDTWEYCGETCYFCLPATVKVTLIQNRKKNWRVTCWLVTHWV